MTGEIAPPVKAGSRGSGGRTCRARVSSEPALEEETQRYVTQALTDVDLFSSYGLTQKAIDLLETVLERAPQHTPVLERLLDLSVGAGNDRRTVELAATLEQIAIERKDRAAAERYAEFRRRFQRAAGITPEDAGRASAQPSAAAPQEFAVPTIEAELDEPVAGDSCCQRQLRPQAPDGHSHAGRIGRARSGFVGRMGGAFPAVGRRDRRNADGRR